MNSLVTQGELLALQKLLPRHSFAKVFDVGANTGEWSNMAVSINPKIELHTFEPQTYAFQVLIQELTLKNPDLKHFPNQLGLSDVQAMLEFHEFDEPRNSGLASLHRRNKAEQAGLVPPPSRKRLIPLTTIDEYCKSNNINRIDYLKIDTEGHELAVLKGGQGMLSRQDIDIIQFEYGGTYQDSGITLQEVFNMLEQFNYNILKIESERIMYVPNFSETLENYKYSNYIAIHQRFSPLILGKPKQMIPIKDLLQKNDIKPIGVIHIGAHEGQEYSMYKDIGFEKILFVEANPSVYKTLKKKLGNMPGVLTANFAVTNQSGIVKLNVTSMSQSSSILALKHHSELYPEITVDKVIEVPSITLDDLLSSLDMDPSEFNFLSMDVQGSELSVLQGATNVLSHIEAINSEFCLAELYEGCPLLAELDHFLNDEFSFKRIALASPYHPTWGDAFYIRKPSLTMSSFTKNGRFGNQLFQYSFMAIHAKNNDLKLELPTWKGCELFNLCHPEPSPKKRLYKQSSDSLKLGTPDKIPVLNNTDTWGYFQFHSSFLSKDKEFIQALFQPKEELALMLNSILDNLVRDHSTLVCLHLRRTDYVGNPNPLFFEAPSEWYKAWLEDIWNTLKNPILYIASDELTMDVMSVFANFNPTTSKDLKKVDYDFGDYLDFYLMTQSHALAISNSTYSYFASLLNTKGSIFARPDPARKRIIPYIPWNSDVLLSDS